MDGTEAPQLYGPYRSMAERIPPPKASAGTAERSYPTSGDQGGEADRATPHPWSGGGQSLVTRCRSGQEELPHV